MPTAIDNNTAGSGGGTNSIIKALDAIKAMDAADKKLAESVANLKLTELPQDARSPINETPRDGGSINNYNAQGSPEVAGNIHAWVSPNKSDEVPSSKESSPDASNQTLPSSKSSSPESFNLNITALTDDNKENVENSFSNANDAASAISVVGKGLMEQKKPGVPPLGLAEVSSNAMTDLNFDASNKDWVKIVHEGREVMVMLHNDVSVVVFCFSTVWRGVAVLLYNINADLLSSILRIEICR